MKHSLKLEAFRDESVLAFRKINTQINFKKDVKLQTNLKNLLRFCKKL